MALLGLLAILVIAGIGLAFRSKDLTRVARLSSSFGLPREWLNNVSFNRYARRGHAFRIAGLALGSLAGFAIATVAPLDPSAVVYVCEVREVLAGPPGSSGTMNVPPSGPGPVQPTIAPVTTRPPTPLLPAVQGRSENGSYPWAPATGRSFGWSAGGGRITWQTDGARLAPNGPITCPPNTVPQTGAGIASSERLEQRRQLSESIGALIGFAVASVLAERRVPRLVTSSEDGSGQVNEPFPAQGWRVGSAVVLGTMLAAAVIAVARDGTDLRIVWVMVCALGISGILAWSGRGTPRSPADSDSHDAPLFVPLYRRRLLDYLRPLPLLAWFATLVTTIGVSIRSASGSRLQNPVDWFSSPLEYWVCSLAMVGGVLVSFGAALRIIRSRSAFDSSDPRALIVDDARRSAAVQRIAGATMLLSVIACRPFAFTYRSSLWTTLSAILAVGGAVLWWLPAGMSTAATKRWRSIVRTQGRTQQDAIVDSDSLAPHLVDL